MQEHVIILSSRIKRVLDYIEVNHEIGPSLKQASNAIGISKFHFERVFKKEVGLPYKKYLNIYRYFRVASTLRSHPNISITNLCSDSCFGDLSNFMKMFKKILGCSPKKFTNCSRDPANCSLRKQSYLFRLLLMMNMAI